APEQDIGPVAAGQDIVARVAAEQVPKIHGDDRIDLPSRAAIQCLVVSVAAENEVDKVPTDDGIGIVAAVHQVAEFNRAAEHRQFDFLATIAADRILARIAKEQIDAGGASNDVVAASSHDDAAQGKREQWSAAQAEHQIAT